MLGLGQHEPDEHLQAPPLHRRQPDARRGRGQPVEVLLEPERAAAVHAQRLEGRTAAEEPLVVGADDRLGRIDEPAARDGEREDAHVRAASGSREPIASSSGRALTHDSSTSVAGSESQTMPPPTQRWIAPSAIANVLIVSARSKSPLP